MKVFEGLYAFLWQNHTQNNCNAYLIDKGGKILIDPGHLKYFSHVTRSMEGLKISLDEIKLVILTHGHPDHAEAFQRLDGRALFAMNKEEHLFIGKFVGNYLSIPEPDLFLGEGDLTVDDQRFLVIVTPGHSPGSICLYWPEKKALFSGDLIFNQGIGRTDLPGGNGKQLKESIQRIEELDIEILLPGHGGLVIGKKAVQDNFRMIENTWLNYL
jgi:hydroxyacylglutathione hydrolase